MRQDDGFDGAILRFQQRRDFETAESGKIHIQHRDVGFMFKNGFQSGIAVARFGHHLEPSIFTQKVAQPFAAKRIFIDDDYPKLAMGSRRGARDRGLLPL